MSSNQGFCVAGPGRMEQVLDAMARRIYATLGRELALVGILRRGVPLAQALGRRLEALGARPLGVGEVSLKRYADDLSVLHEQPRLKTSPLPFDV